MAGALCALVVVAQGQVDPARVIATVNGETIKGAEYYHRMEYLPGVGRFSGNRFAEMPPGFMTLDTLITEKLVLQLARSKNILPTDPEVEAELRNRLEENPRLLQDAIEGGLTKDDVTNQLRLELAQFKIVTYGITITDQEVEAHYNGHQPQFTIPKRVKLRLIAVPYVAKEDLKDKPDARLKVDADLKSGKTFAEVAKADSFDTSKAIGGDIGLLPLYTFPDEVKAELAKVKIGQATAWIKQGTAWVKYYYEDAKPEEKIPLTPALRRSIRRELMLVKGGVKNNLRDEMKSLRKAAKIEITEKDFADAYKKFVDQYLGGG